MERVELGDLVGERIRHYRRQRDWTQQDLADAMGAVGYPTSRTTLLRLEKGGTRVGNISLREVLVVAAALGVPPILLFAPFDEREVGVTPAISMAGERALQWFTGAEPLSVAVPGGKGERHAVDLDVWARTGYPIYMARLHAELVAELLLAWPTLPAEVSDPERWHRTDDALRRLAQHRAAMLQAGMATPALEGPYEDRANKRGINLNPGGEP